MNKKTCYDSVQSYHLIVIQPIDASDKTITVYKYDKAGNKANESVTKDEKNILLELDSLGNVSARNAFGTKLISREVTGSLKGFYRYNGHGDVVKIVDKSGKVLVEYYYDAFGTLKECIGNFDNPYRYSGYIYDEEAKYYYLQSRMYDPILGRFIQEDSYRGDEKDPLSLNLYTYCLNNPMIYDNQNGHWPSFLSKIGSAISSACSAVKSFASNVWNGITSLATKAWNGIKSVAKSVVNFVSKGVSWAKQTYNNVKRTVKATANYLYKKYPNNRYVKIVKSTLNTAQRAYNYTKTQMNKAIQAIKKIDVSKLAVGALNLIQGGAAIGLGVGLTAVCPPAGVGLVALGTGTALIGFGQAADAVVHEDPVRNFANNLGISNSAYDTASEVVPLLTSLGCMAAPSVLSFSALRSGASTASSAVDTVANMSEHANEAEKRVISYETDSYSVYTEGSYNKAPKPNYGPLARDVAGDNRGAALKGRSNSKLVEIIDHKSRTFKINDWSAYPDDYVPLPDKNKVWTLLEGNEYETARKQANGVNRNLRKSDNYYSNNRLEIHEVEPVKFGGSPTDLSNKAAIQGQAHRKYVTPWWNKIRDEVKKGLDK